MILKNWLKNNGQSLSIIVLLMGILVTTTFWILYKFDSCDFDFSSMCEILTATIITLLGVAITSYIFLHTELQSRKKDNPYMKKAIDRLLEKNRRHLVINCLIALFALAVLITAYEFNIFNRIILIFILLVSYISMVWLVLFNISIIDHNKALLKKALAELRKMEVIATESNIPNGTLFIQRRAKNLEYEGFLKEVSDIQIIVEKIIMNHSRQMIGTPESSQLAAILKLKSGNTLFAERFSKQYEWLHDYRDLLLVVSGMLGSNDKTECNVPNDLPNQIENDLIKWFVSDELLTDISLSKKHFINADFSGTSFAGSFLYSVDFEDSILTGSSFENSQLTNIKITGKSLFTSINFYRAVIQCEFSNNMQFLYCNFSEADFSRQSSELKGLKFDFSNFRRANFIGQIDGKNGLLITDCSMTSTICSFAKFMNAKVLRVDFTSANMREVEFTSAIILECGENGNSGFYKANLESAIFYYAIIERSDFSNSRLEKANFIHAEIIKCNFCSSYGNDVSFRDCVIRGESSRFEVAIFTNSDFSNANIRNATFYGTTFTNSMFNQTVAINTSFANCIFIGVQLLDSPSSPVGCYSDCDFSESIFDNSIVDGVRFCKCDFNNSSFNGAILKNTDFCACTGLQPDMFDGVDSIDSYTLIKLSDCGCIISHQATNAENPPQDIKCQTVAQVLSKRRSTRYFKSDFYLGRSVIESLIDAARKAPSAKNRQPWKFFILNDRAKIVGLANKMMEINDDGNGNSIIDSNSINTLANASAVIFVLYDKDNNEQNTIPDYQSIGACIENLIIQATAHDIDSLWMCDPLGIHDSLKSFLGLTLDFVAVILLGKHEDDGNVNKKSLEDICIWD